MRIKIPIQVIALEEHNFHIAITCRFYDGTSGLWIIDTGASKTVFDKNRADYFFDSGEEEEFHSAGISNEPLKSAIATLKPLQFEKFNIEQLTVALLDLAHINELYQKVTNREICGLIGSDFLLKYAAVIDYKKRLLILSD